ncbi:MAG TPA: RecX family transcriptional regulator, partial [Candidatus Solibacter sp.]|nr:RecX family transcriptional regulator [Candidatus Solibacter sp.]
MQDRKPRRLDSDGLWNYALRALGGRAHSIGELREKLRRRAERMEDVEATIGRLKESGYLNDERFAEGYAAARLSSDRLGRTRVLR